MPTLLVYLSMMSSVDRPDVVEKRANEIMPMTTPVPMAALLRSRFNLSFTAETTTSNSEKSDVKPAMANLNRAVASAQRSMETLDQTLQDARPGVKNFTTQTLPEANQLVRDLSEMAEALTGVASRLDRGGAGAVLGGNKLPDYNPK